MKEDEKQKERQSFQNITSLVLPDLLSDSILESM